MTRPFNPQPKPEPRITLPGKTWHHLIGMKDGWRCRDCGQQTHWAGMSAHHIVKRSQGGDDVAENGAYLCGSGTSGCHGAVEGKLHWALTEFRRKMLVTELAYVCTTKSRDWLEQHYPSV